MQITRTLLVDDDERFRQQLSEFLARAPDVEVIGEAEDGQEAISKARELKPDLILMDMRMPRMTGVNATRQLREEMPELKVIMLTVFDLPEYRETALAIGANDYVVKKSLTEELLPTIRRVCSAQGAVISSSKEREKRGQS